MQTFLQILQFFPFVLGGVIAVEQAAASTPGVTKKQMVLDGILVAAKLGEQVPVPTVALVSALIDQIVTSLNASGLFTHNKAAIAAPAAH